MLIGPISRRLTLITLCVLAVAAGLVLGPSTTGHAATIEVTTTADSVGVNGAVSLREAILSINGIGDQNADVTARRTGTYGVNDTIEFDILGTGVKTINVGEAVSGGLGLLPTISRTVTIDGYTQGIAKANGLAVGSDAVLLIELNGQNAGASDDSHGLTIEAASVTIKGLVINRFSGDGIRVRNVGATGAVIRGNFVGTDTDGTGDLGNGFNGIHVLDAPNAAIGGAAASDRNVASGNGLSGIIVEGSSATGSTIRGNYAGTDAAGTAVLANGSTGIEVVDAPNAMIGGTEAGARNVVSGNSDNHGIRVSGGSATHVAIQGNYAGTDATGTAPLPNGLSGISVAGAPNVTVGGTEEGARNVASGNGSNGIEISDSGATGATIRGNYAGTNFDGTGALGNGADGITVIEAANATIGGVTDADRNIASGNGGNGIKLDGVGATGATIKGNYTGTNALGTAALQNGNTGIAVFSASDVTIGGAEEGARNVASGNAVHGIQVRENDATGVTIRGNYVGMDVNGTTALGNGFNGINVFAVPNATIGGTATGDGNVVSGNGEYGINVEDATATGAVIQGNQIGTDVAGTAARPNGLAGIRINGALGATIGGTATGASNVIAFNVGAGVLMVAGNGNAVRGNAIFSNGGLGIDLAPVGVTVNDAGDGDSGPNNRQNFPVLTSASVGSGVTHVVGTLNSTASMNFTIDVYVNPMCDSSGNGEGRTYLASTAVSTNPSGNANFILNNLDLVAAGSAITATATSQGNSTSEFSVCLTALAAGVSVTPGAVGVIEDGASGAFTVALTSIPISSVTITPSFNAALLDISPSTLTFLADSSALSPQTVTVSADPNTTADGTRTSPITFTAASGSSQYNGFAVNPATAIITDDESAGGLTIANLSIAEPGSGTSIATLTVTLSRASSQAVTVQYATANGTATGGTSCTDGVDYVTTSGPLTFNPSQLTRPITVTICGDNVADLNEAFTVALSNPAGPATLGAQPTATVTITNTGGQLSAATADSYAVVNGNTLSIPVDAGVLANDGSIGVAGVLTAQVVTEPGHGTLSLATNGGFTYTPNIGYAGTDTFTYRATDGTFSSPPATVTIAVTPTACVPRPRVQTMPTAGGGALRVRIEATPLNTQANNLLQKITFGRYLNAAVTLNGQSFASGDVYVVPAGVVFVDFTVTRVSPGLGTTVEFSVLDGCGTWNTLVGGGSSAGF